MIEDSYGPIFIQNLVTTLKTQSYISNNLEIKSVRYTLYKLKTILHASIENYDRIIILIDCDGDCNSGNSFFVIKEIHKFHSPKIIQICFDSEIEDWLCVSLNLQNNNMKSSLALKIHYNYEKYMLPKYVNKLNFDTLETNCPFQKIPRFIEVNFFNAV